MLQDQTKHLREMMNDRNGRAETLAITSGKGGVGKTNISANLAICLAASGKRIVMMDADMGMGNLDVILNVNSRFNISHVVSGQKRLSEIIHAGPGGIEIICGGSGIEELANLSDFQQNRLVSELNSLQDKTDMLIVDTGAGIGASTVSFCMACEHTLVITTPEPTAITDAYAMIKVLSGRKYDGRISLLVNMARTTTEGKKIYHQIADVAAKFLNVALYEAGVICRDEKLPAAVRMRQPVVLAYPKSNITSSLVAVAARLSKGLDLETSRDGFFQKVVGWFA